MTFKEQVAADIVNTFFNEDEFADWHEVAIPGEPGRRMLLIIDEDDLERRDKAMETLSRLALLNSIELPLYKNAVTIYVPAAMFGPRLRPRSRIILDRERRLEIQEFISEGGVYIIVCAEVL